MRARRLDTGIWRALSIVACVGVVYWLLYELAGCLLSIACTGKYP